MTAVSGSAAEPSGRAETLPPVPPLVKVDDTRGWWSWWTRVAVLSGRARRPAGGLLLTWTVLPALPAAGTIALVAQAFEQRVGRANPGNSLGWGAGLIFAAVLLPVVIAGGYLIARGWTGVAVVTAFRAAGEPTRAADGVAGGRGGRCLRLWAGYVAGIAVMCAIAALAGDLMTNDHLVKAVLVSVGPLGLLSPVIVLAPARIYAASARPSGQAARGAADRARLGAVIVGVLAYQLVVGIAVSPLVDAARAAGVLGVLLAFLLSIPSTLLLAAAGHASYAARHATAAAA
jgi:hypothetical protein